MSRLRQLVAMLLICVALLLGHLKFLLASPYCLQSGFELLLQCSEVRLQETKL